MEIASDSADAAVDRVIAALDYPLLIVTTASAEARAGCLVGFATQCSVDPQLLLVCISRENRTCRVAREATGVAIHCISEDERDLAQLFGGETGDDIDKFERCDWSEGPLGLPVLDRSPAWVAGTIEERFEAGDHVAHVIAPEAADLRRSFAPLPTSAGTAIDAGHGA